MPDAGPSIPEIADALNRRIDDVVAALGLSGRREGNDIVAFNPTRVDRRLGSFRVCVSGSKQGVWCEFASGETGDALDLVAYCQGWSKHDALAWAKGFLGLLVDGRPALKKPPARDVPAGGDGGGGAGGGDDTRTLAQKRAAAKGLWLAGARVTKWDPVERYLWGRGLSWEALAESPRALRYLARCREPYRDVHHPAMVAAVVHIEHGHINTHRTYLQLHPVNAEVVHKAPILRGGKAVMAGGYAGGFIALQRGASGKSMKDAPDGEAVAITEGIEDGLTVALACPELRVIAAVALANMAAVVLPPQIGAVILCADNDAPGSPATKALERAVELHMAAGRVVRVAHPETAFKDFNEVLRQA